VLRRPIETTRLPRTWQAFQCTCGSKISPFQSHLYAGCSVCIVTVWRKQDYVPLLVKDSGCRRRWLNCGGFSLEQAVLVEKAMPFYNILTTACGKHL